MSTAVGLDIGWKSIRAVELTNDRVIKKIASIDISDGTKKEEFKVYIAKLTEFFNESKFSKDNVIINLRGSYILTRTYEPSASGNDGFERWFVENIDSLIPGAPLNDVIYDHEFLDDNRVLISFARLRVIENRLKMLRACGIMPVAVDASCLALYRSFRNHKPLKKYDNYAIIDLGSYKTDLLLVRDSIPFISTDLAIGYKEFNKGRDRCRMFCKLLSKELKKKLDYYKTKENLIIDYLIVVGNYAKTAGMKKNLTSLLKVRTEIGKPFKVQKIDLPLKLSRKNNSQYTQALGLALKGLKTDIGVNLIPHEVKRERRKWEFNKQAKKFFGKNLVFSGIIFFMMTCLLGIMIVKYNKIKHDFNELLVTKSGLVYLNDEEKEINSKVLKLQQLGHEQFFWSKMLLYIGQAVPDGVFFKEISTDTRLVSVGTKPVKQRKVVIEGDARNHALIIRFIQNLEKRFTDITIDRIKRESRCKFKISIGI